MFLYAFILLLVSDCCLFCSAISYLACSSFPITFCCLKTDAGFRRTVKAGSTERFPFLAEYESCVVYCPVEGWKDIANILTIPCFPGCFLQVETLCYCTSSCQRTRQDLFLYVRSSVVWAYSRYWQEAQVLRRLLYFRFEINRYIQFVSIFREFDGIEENWQLKWYLKYRYNRIFQCKFCYCTYSSIVKYFWELLQKP